MSKSIFFGSGKNRFQVNHNWLKFVSPSGEPTMARIPQKADVQGLSEDPETGELYLTFAEDNTYPASTIDGVLVFNEQGVFVRSFAPEVSRGGHSVRFISYGKRKYVFVCCVETCKVYKYDAITGQLLLTCDKPHSYGENKFKPTSVSPLSDGGFVVSDGYGSNFILIYDQEGQLIRSFNTPKRKNAKPFDQPHGITVIDNSQLIIADRQNHRIVFCDLKGNFIHTVKLEKDFPCNIHIRSENEIQFLVPNLWHEVSVYDSSFTKLVELGNGITKHTSRQFSAKGTFDYRKGLVSNRIEETAIDPNYFLYPHDAIWTRKHSGREGNILVCEWNHYLRGTGVTLLERCPE